ncbi:MAG: HAMP domain-containing protein [Chloroflexi bacterium]|nr:MAG: HAMP domain-containing protein [Chloroflexota bacterium]
MSVQTRFLTIYTLIFGLGFVMFALLVYFLPSRFILTEIDREMEALAAEILRPGNVSVGRDGSLQVNLPEDLANLETASTFALILTRDGRILARSRNLEGFNQLLDENGLQTEPVYHQVYQNNTQLRVLTVPIRTEQGELVGYLQVGRLLEYYENFSRLLVAAMLVGAAAVTASVFVAVWVTPGVFKPLDEITAVAHQITRADDLSRRVPNADRNDEIGVLAQALNQTLERLERLFQTQQRLLADVSHELRTPLTAIRGNLDLMRRMGEADPESLAIIQEEVDRMTRLVGDLMMLARADAGGLPLERKPVELDNLLFEVYRQAILLAKSVSVRLTEVDQVCVLGDADRLKQLFLNLIDNAIKYTPDGGEIELRLSKNEGWAIVSVSDTGVGIPAEDLPYIFDRFYRVDKARNRKQGGTGLGLAIAKWIAEAHGGKIQVESTVGEGTTFTVLIPLLEQEDGAYVSLHKEPDVETKNRSRLGRLRVNRRG